ncbi:MAG: hypothetical protein ACE5GA_06740 [Candidatus Zixiibacteriota bacterium]
MLKNATLKNISPLLALTCVLGTTHSAAAGERFGSQSKMTSFGVFAGASAVTGKIDGFGTVGFPGKLGADTLYRSLSGFGMEYAEHIGKVSLATGLNVTAVSSTDALRSSLGLADSASLSVVYIDIPVTYRVSARGVDSENWNLSAGVSLIAMLDFIDANQDIFASESGSDGSAGSGGLSDKHLDFGVGFGAEVAARQRLSGNMFIAGRVGARTPISGVTRATAGFAQLGLLWLTP